MRCHRLADSRIIENTGYINRELIHAPDSPSDSKKAEAPAAAAAASTARAAATASTRRFVTSVMAASGAASGGDITTPMSDVDGSLICADMCAVVEPATAPSTVGGHGRVSTSLPAAAGLHAPGGGAANLDQKLAPFLRALLVRCRAAQAQREAKQAAAAAAGASAGTASGSGGGGGGRGRLKK